MRTVRLLLIALITLGISPGWAHAQIDPETIVGIWLLNEGAGDVAEDASGNGNDGTLNGPQWTATGKFDGGLDFDGAGSYIEFATGEAMKTPHFTIMAWFSTRKLNGYGHLFQTGNDWNDMAGYVLRVHLEGTVQAGLAFGPGNTTTFVTGPTLDANTWYHAALTYDGTTATLYLDGENVSSNPGAGQGEIMYDDMPVRIGTHSGDTGSAFDGLLDEVGLFNVALAVDDIRTIMDTGLEEILGGSAAAFDPVPENGQTDVPRDGVLSWTAGMYANTHNVYFGISMDDVAEASTSDPRGVLAGQGLADTSFDPEGLLDYGRTYYWRVDEVNAPPDSTVTRGDIWSFTAEPYVYPVTNITATASSSEAGYDPANTINGSGLDADDRHSTDKADMWQTAFGQHLSAWIQYEFDQAYHLTEMWVWNHNTQLEQWVGFGFKDVTIQYSVDGVEWTVLATQEFTRAPGADGYAHDTTIDFQGVMARYVRLTAASPWGTTIPQAGLSEVRFYHLPVEAREPQPSPGATGVGVEAVLSWRPGRKAAAHEVYFDTDMQTVADGTAFVDRTTATSYAPGSLNYGTRYYWKIVEVNDAEPPAAWEGQVWDFTTTEYTVVDDFESYTNDSPNRVFQTWIDGWGFSADEFYPNGNPGNGTGAAAGHDIWTPGTPHYEGSIVETLVVNSGRQSMPMYYDNSAAPFYSEVERDLGGIDLDTNGAGTLRLFVAGQAPEFHEGPDGTILMNAIGRDIWDEADEFRYAYKSLTGDGSIIARVDDLDAAPNAWAKAGVMVRRTADPGSAHTMMILTGGAGNGASWQGRLVNNASSESQDAVEVVAPPYWVKVERVGNDFSGFVSPDGDTWTQIGTARTVTMNDPVLIGLALTSHNVNQATSAQFSNVSFTGNVSGDWQVAEIGVAQPLGNDLAPLYVVLRDSAGQTAVVTNPDAAVIGRSTWTEWLIPYSELGGINLNSVRTMYIGVGNRANPTADGTGLIFIDDIGYGHPAPAQ